MESVPIKDMWWEGDDMIVSSSNGKILRLENAKRRVVRLVQDDEQPVEKDEHHG